MTAPSEKTLNYGLRYANIFELNANLYPKATGATPYEGRQVKGSTAFELNIPDSRTIVGLGEDGITQIVTLPPNESASGKLNVEAADPVLAALLDSTLVETLGDISLVGVATDRQGYEPQVGGLFYQACTGLETGKTYWHSYFVPSMRCIRKAPGMAGDKAVTAYQIAPNRVNRHLWGTSFSLLTQGYQATQVVEAWSNYPLRLTSFLGDGVEDEFSFSADNPSVNAIPIVIVNGVKKTITTDYTATTGKVTFVAPPADDAVICVLREVVG